MEKGASEILKLTERIAKDPKSKLFVPLAEEYKKAGDIEMAIHVLTEGLKNNPTYITARSFLGRLLLEQGDLAGAQKELEEVIKAIPDNLLAQRKLGDIYVLQARSNDAIQRYKAALALNPGDKELSSLVADLEAGRDVSARIPQPKLKPKPAASPEPTKQAGSAQPIPPVQKTIPAEMAKPFSQVSVQTPVAASDKPAPSKKEPIRSAVQASQPSNAQPEQGQVAASPGQVQQVFPAKEVAEEIIELEPLAITEPESTARPPEQTPVSETTPEPKSTSFEESAGVAFDLSEPDRIESASAENADAAWLPEKPADETQEQKAESYEQKDDINTNTLAELYISQGFFEKAIEIYSGMLSEDPGNEALRQKLEKIKAMAGVAERNAAFTAQSSLPVEDISSKDLFAGSADSKEKVTEAKQPAADIETAVPQQEDTSQLRTTHILRDVTEHSTLATSLAAEIGSAEKSEMPRGPQRFTGRRKETIDRLELWLKNIMKEKSG